MASLSIYRILAVSIPPVFIGEAMAQNADLSAVSQLNRKALDALQGTLSVEVKPQFAGGKLWACGVEFAAIERDWIYKQGNHIRIGGSFGAANMQGEFGVVLKVILHDIDVRVSPVTYIPSPPASAYFFSGSRTTTSDVVSSYPSDVAGAIFVVLKAENALRFMLDGLNRSKVGIAFARKKGQSDIQVTIDTTVVETKGDGSRVRSAQPEVDFLGCLKSLIN